MLRSNYSVVQQKIGIIYDVLSPIHMIQTLKILTLKTNYWQIHINKVPVTYFCLYVKACNKLCQSDTHGDIDQDQYPYYYYACEVFH